MTAPLLEVNDLVVSARSRGTEIALVDGISLTVDKGEIVGLVGESGCGKSTTSNAIMRLFGTPSVRQTAGELVLDGERYDTLRPGQMAKIRGARIAMIFQDPSTYLDPMMTVGRQVGEGLRVHQVPGDHGKRVVELLGLMGLPDPEGMVHRYPHELSGGQRQRVLIAAALAADPDVIIADEPSTALDVTVQAQILALLRELRDTLGVAILFITHDLGVVAEMCDRVYVMYAGRIVEAREIHALYAEPRHPYTAGLLASTLSSDSDVNRLFSIPGTVPDPRAMPPGCRFASRCPLADDRCRAVQPVLATVDGGQTACWHHDQVDADLWSRHG
jgi:oligopeptide/dipeptide ABC transporter ATP-binding protein